MAPELPSLPRNANAIKASNFSGGPAQPAWEDLLVRHERALVHSTLLRSGMQTNAANNYAHFEAIPSTSTTLHLTAFESPHLRSGPAVLELSFQLAETVVPTLSGLPSHSRSRDPLVIWSHVAESYQQAARNVLGKTK